MKKKILYLDNTYTFGGAINSLLYMLRELDKNKFEPIMVTGQPESYLSKHFSFMRWYSIKVRVPWVHGVLYSRLLKTTFFSNAKRQKFLGRLRAVFWLVLVTFPESLKYYFIGKRHGVSLVHLNNILGSQEAGIIAAKLLRVPCVAHLRMYEEVSRATIQYAKWIDHHIAISRSIQDNLRQLSVPKEKITIVHNAIDLADFAVHYDTSNLLEEFGPATCRIGMFGRILPWKGSKEFLEAMQIVLVTQPKCQALVVGDVSDGALDYYKEIETFINDAGLSHQIIMTGFRSDIPELMQFMDIVVHASITPEPFGRVIIEAMAAGKPVVATKAGGPLDIVKHGETGLLVEPGNVQELAEAILSLVQSTGLRSQYGGSGKQRAIEAFSSRRCAKQVEQLYQDILSIG